MTIFREWKGLSVPEPLFQELLSGLGDVSLMHSRSQLWDLAIDNRMVYSPIFRDGEETGEHQLIAVLETADNGISLQTQPRDFHRSTNGINVAGLPSEETTMTRFDERFPNVSHLAVRQYVFERFRHNAALVYAAEFCGEHYLHVGLAADAPIILTASYGNILEPHAANGIPIRQVMFHEHSFRDKFLDGNHCDWHHFPNGVDSDCLEFFKGSVFPGGGKKGKFGISIGRSLKNPHRTVDHVSQIRVIVPAAAVHTANEQDSDSLEEPIEVGMDHKGNSGGAKSETAQPLHRTPNGDVDIGVYLPTHQPIPAWAFERKHECVVGQVVDDIQDGLITKLSHIKPDESRNWWAPTGSENGLILVGKDGEPIWWFLRGDDFSEANCPFPTLNRAGHRNVFLNVRRKGDFIVPWLINSTNARVNFPKADSCDTVDGRQRIHIRRFGVRVNAGAPLAVVSRMSPAAYCAWTMAGPSLSTSPSYTGSDNLVPNEGPGTVDKFHPRHRRNVIIKEIENAQALGGNVRYSLVPNMHVGLIKGGYNIPRMAVQLTAWNLGRFWTGAGFIPHIGGGLFGQVFDGIPAAAGVPLPNGNWFARPWEQPDMGIDVTKAACADIVERYFKPLMQRNVFDDRARLPKKAVEIATAACDGASESEFAAIIAA